MWGWTPLLTGGKPGLRSGLADGLVGLVSGSEQALDTMVLMRMIIVMIFIPVNPGVKHEWDCQSFSFYSTLRNERTPGLEEKTCTCACAVG
jgi:hypothetical protein